jgi:hypothetical protein
MPAVSYVIITHNSLYVKSNTYSTGWVFGILRRIKELGIKIFLKEIFGLNKKKS